MNCKICANCHVELYPKENGVWVLEWAGSEPYKLWHADLWGCRGCDAQVILGVGANPVREHIQSDFASFINCISDRKETIIDYYEHLAEATGK